MDLLKSKKFQAALVGLAVVILQAVVPGLEAVDPTEVIGVIVAYIIGQGLADFGKEAKKL